MNTNTLEQQIKNFALNVCKMDKVGIASIDRFNESPEGFHPTDFLPGCQSVIVFCTRLPDGAVEIPFRVYEDDRIDMHGAYPAFGYVGSPNYKLLFGSYKVARFIEKKTDEVAMPQTSGPTHGKKMLSMRHAAYCAGLGEFGWNSLMLTPEFGPRNRFGVVLTTLKLNPDPMYNGPRLCDPSKCHVCEKMCPSGAIPPYVEGSERKVCSGGKESIYSGINWAKCRLMCEGTHKEYNDSGKDLVPREMDNPIFEEMNPLVNAYYGKHENIRTNFWQHNPTWKCGHCLSYCPVGNWYERFGDTGLSKIDIEKYIDK